MLGRGSRYLGWLGASRVLPFSNDAGGDIDRVSDRQFQSHPGERLDGVSKTGKTSLVTARISTKGQLVIPQQLRKALNLRPGDKVSFSLQGEKLLVRREEPKRARLKEGKFGRPVLIAPRGAPAMTAKHVKALLEELP